MRLGIGVFALVLAGCISSPETRYYSLVSVASGHPTIISGRPMQVFHVTIPATLDRESLVEWAGSGELKISSRDRWAGPLDDMIQAVLAGDLRERLPGMVVLPGDPAPPGDSRGVVINVRHFAAENGQHVVLLADWSLTSGQPRVAVLNRSEVIEIPLSSDRTSDVVSAMSHALGMLSDRIAKAVIAAERPGDGGREAVGTR
ncbi:MAG: PqiC family protein [Candidatus Binataceae bacterium]